LSNFFSVVNNSPKPFYCNNSTISRSSLKGKKGKKISIQMMRVQAGLGVNNEAFDCFLFT